MVFSDDITVFDILRSSKVPFGIRTTLIGAESVEFDPIECMYIDGAYPLGTTASESLIDIESILIIKILPYLLIDIPPLRGVMLLVAFNVVILEFKSSLSFTL